MIQCERGHFYDENRNQTCPYCVQVSNAPKSVNPPIQPMNMEIPKPSCGKTVAIEGMQEEPQVCKTVALENFEVDTERVNKTVAISEPVIETPSFEMPAVAPVQINLVPQVTVPEVAVPQVTAPEVAVPQMVAPQMPVVNAQQDTEPVQETQNDRPYAVTGLGVSDNPKPLAKEENYYQPAERPYAVTGLGVKENPTPIPVETGATFPIPSAEGNAAAAGQPEAAAFAAFGFPGGPMGMPGAPMGMPGMPMGMPGMPMGMPSAPASSVAAPVPQPVESDVKVEPDMESYDLGIDAAVETEPDVLPEVDTSVESETESVTESEAIVEESNQVTDAVSEVSAVEEKQASPVEVASPVVEPAPAPAEEVVPARPVDPNATVAIVDSDMDYIPRVHARAFLVCTDGPMTGASFVFQEDKAIVGRQKNYEISLFRDVSVSRDPHAVIHYYADSVRYTVSCGDEQKRVMVNGQFITGETDLKLYDVIGIGQTRLLFIPVCSDKFAW